MALRQPPVPIRYLLAAALGASLGYGLLLLTMGTRAVDAPDCLVDPTFGSLCQGGLRIPRPLWVDLAAAALGAIIGVWVLAFKRYVDARWEGKHGKIDASTSVVPT